MRSFRLPFSEDRFANARRRMVRDQLEARGIRDVRVLDAMGEVPRERFVGQAQRERAYEDGPLPIGEGQTISQPYTVAFMIEALKLSASDRALEVGCGCGYAAAVMSKLVREVHTIERLEPLAADARARLAELGFGNIHVHHADGTLGLPDLAPFDAIVVAAGGKSEPPQPLLDQLAIGGRLVIPLGDAPRSQAMRRYTRRSETDWVSESLGAFAFVPLIGKHAWDPDAKP